MDTTTKKINLVIVGTIGLDNIETPFGKVVEILGGSAVYASVAASNFGASGIISIAGKDLPKDFLKPLTNRNIDLEGVRFQGKTFRWSGKYDFEMNEAKTLKTELNSLSDFKPEIPEKYKKAKYLLLGNIDPDLQLEVINQMKDKPFIITDTMNFWIKSKRQSLIKVIKKSNVVVINEGEARQLFETSNLISAGHKLIDLGLEYAIIKKGEHGALLFSDNNYFSAPGYPLEEVKDPTGCGDSFAGGMIGYLARTKDTTEPNMRKAIIYGSAVASCCAESFGLDYCISTSFKNIRERYNVFEKIRRF